MKHYEDRDIVKQLRAELAEEKQKVAGFEKWLSGGVYFTESEYEVECKRIKELEALLLSTEAEHKAERDALLKDAERYRWLRMKSDLTFSLSKKSDWCGGCYPTALDAAIDAAMKEGK